MADIDYSKMVPETVPHHMSVFCTLFNEKIKEAIQDWLYDADSSLDNVDFKHPEIYVDREDSQYHLRMNDMPDVHFGRVMLTICDLVAGYDNSPFDFIVLPVEYTDKTDYHGIIQDTTEIILNDYMVLRPDWMLSTKKGYYQSKIINLLAYIHLFKTSDMHQATVKLTISEESHNPMHNMTAGMIFFKLLCDYINEHNLWSGASCVYLGGTHYFKKDQRLVSVADMCRFCQHLPDTYNDRYKTH